MKTTDIVVLRPQSSGRDRMNQKVNNWIEEKDPVPVIAAPGSSAELDASRPEGVRVAWTLHFPKSYTGSLLGCKVRFAQNEYRVIGDPQPYMPENTPGMFNRPVEVEAVDG